MTPTPPNTELADKQRAELEAAILTAAQTIEGYVPLTFGKAAIGKCLKAAQSHLATLREDKGGALRPLPDHDNHHNALKCPYCNPNGALDIEDVFPIAEIQSFVEYQGSQTKAADALGISDAYISDILNRRREVSDNIAAKFGWVKCWKRKAALKNPSDAGGGAKDREIADLKDLIRGLAKNALKAVGGK